MTIADIELTPCAPVETRSQGRNTLARPTADDRRAVALGISVCAILPAVFWCAAIWCFGHVIGWPPSPLTLLTIAASIMTFLTIVASSVMAAR